MEWLSPNRFVFEWQRPLTKAFPSGIETCETKVVLVIAEKGKNLYFLEDGGHFAKIDVLCWFCENSISLGRPMGTAPTCLRGIYFIGTKFCLEFSPGLPFGESWERDAGKRREIAERLLPKMSWQCCNDCAHWDTKNAYRRLTKVERKMLFEKTNSKFCEILMKEPDWEYPETCRNFEVSHELEKRERFFLQQKILRDYIEELKEFEVKQTGKKCDVAVATAKH